MIHDIETLRAEVRARRAAGQTVALVPTMGNLHDGHLSLVRRAGAEADVVIVSIFVNPLQFGPAEDFDRYPRTLETDCERLMEAAAEIVFAPDVPAVYPLGYPPSTSVQLEGAVVEQLEGLFRPGHFRGVATVVAILLNLVQPDVAVFGEKDYQQLAVVQRMVRELALPVRIVGGPTQREADGLAMSSRNQFLRADERPRAAAVFAALQTVASQLRSGRRDYATIERESAAVLRDAGLQPQYLAIRTPALDVPSEDAENFVVLVAAMLGSTRLIDNLAVRLVV